MPTTSNEEIIEKSATSPIATSCLVIACVALIGAIAFQIVEIAAYKTGVPEPTAEPRKGVAQDLADKYISALRKDVQEALDKSVRGGGAGGLEGGLAPEPEGMPEPEEPAEDAGADADTTPSAEPAAEEPSADEPSMDEPSVDEPSMDEPAEEESSTEEETQ